MTRDQVVTLMKISCSEDEWNDNCDKTKKAFGGRYPDFWYAAIVMGGVMRATMGKNADKISIVAV